MGSRKRTRSDAVAATEQQAPEEPSLLQRIRSSWEFASLMQYIAIFGQAMKIDEEFEIEARSLAPRCRCASVAHCGAWLGWMDSCLHDTLGRIRANIHREPQDLEDECMKPEPSHKLLEIGLCLLKWISSHRGLTYVIRCPSHKTRFGLTAQSRFENFDEYTKRQYNAKAPHITNPFGYDEEPLRFLDFDVFQKLRVLHQLSVWTFWNPDRIRDKMPEKKESEQLQWVSRAFANF